MIKNYKTPNYLSTHPRESLQLMVLALTAFWQTPTAVMGFILFLGCRYLKWDGHYLFGLGFFMALGTTLLQLEKFSLEMLLHFFDSVGQQNVELWWLLFQEGRGGHLIKLALINGAGYALFITAILTWLDKLTNGAHEKALASLRQGKGEPPLFKTEKFLNKVLQKIPEDFEEGTLLGVSKVSAKPIVIPDSHINQILLVLGTTGGGKTVTLRRFYRRAAFKRYPLIIVDGKPSQESVLWVEQLAQKFKVKFYGFNCGNFCAYDPMAHGSYTELKDKIMNLKDEWENDYYKSIAEDYLQTTLALLLSNKTPVDLTTLAECLDYHNLALHIRACQDKKLIAQAKRLADYPKKDLTGLQAHLNLLINSEIGHFFEKNATTFNLLEMIQSSGIVYFALPALRYPTFAKILGKLIINDIKTVIDREFNASKIFVVFDEFSVFAGEQVLNLVNMGRGKGLHAIFSTQGLSDLKKVNEVFAHQVLNCANSLICHRLNDQESAENVSIWIGTQDVFKVTAQVGTQLSAAPGSVRPTKEFIVHPDIIKQSLHKGEAIYVTKVRKFTLDQVKVKWT